jgi:nicotinamidase-related amidase
LTTRAASPLAVRTPRRPKADVGTAGQLPRSAAVLLLVDFINPLEFPGSDQLARPALGAARNALRLKQRLARRGLITVYANDNYGRWRSDFRDILALCKGRGGASAEIASLLAPDRNDLVILKPRQSAFFGTPLDMMLTQMHARTLVVCGLAADICVQLTAMDAHLRGYGLWVPQDCTAAELPARKSAALDYMAQTLEADIRSSTRRRALP